MKPYENKPTRALPTLANLELEQAQLTNAFYANRRRLTKTIENVREHPETATQHDKHIAALTENEINSLAFGQALETTSASYDPGLVYDEFFQILKDRIAGHITLQAKLNEKAISEHRLIPDEIIDTIVDQIPYELIYDSSADPTLTITSQSRFGGKITTTSNALKDATVTITDAKTVLLALHKAHLANIIIDSIRCNQPLPFNINLYQQIDTHQNNSTKTMTIANELRSYGYDYADRYVDPARIAKARERSTDVNVIALETSLLHQTV